MNEPVHYSPSVEDVASDEAQTIQSLNETFDIILRTTAEDYGHAVRAVHAKAHAILEGTLTVQPSLPPELTQGMFAKPGDHKVFCGSRPMPGICWTTRSHCHGVWQ